jgi:membrane-associated phospholipid phosphatase
MRTANRDSFFSTLWRRSRPLDRITGGYIIIFALGLLVFGWRIPSTKYLVPVHVALLAAISWMVVNWKDRTRGTSGFLRHLYPAILYTFFYCETAVALHWIFPGFFDAQIIAMERAVLGVDLNVWLIPFQSSFLNEWMMLAYFSYYFVIPALALTLYFQGRTRELHDFLTAVTIAFVISYAGFVLYPIAGPRYFLAEHFDGPLSGRYFVPLVNWIIASAAIHGGCMPSSHVAVALVVLVWAYRTNRRLAYVMMPFVATLFFATVWGRFHYLSDVVVGWFVGVIGLRLAARWCATGQVQVKAESPAALSHVPVTY